MEKIFILHVTSEIFANDFEDDAMHATSFCSGVVVSKLREMARRRHGSIDKLVGNSAMLAQH